MIKFQSPIPDLTGARCRSLLAQEFWHNGKQVSAGNVLFLAVEGGAWHRIVLDGGTGFWRVEAEPSLPGPEMDSEEYGQYPVTDIGAKYGLVGRKIISVRLQDTLEAAELLIDFDDGTTLALRDLLEGDETNFEIRVPAG